jgi:hypothetical protein
MAALRFLFANTYSINCIAWAEFVQLELYEVWYARNSNGEIGDGKVKQCRVCTDSYYDKGLSEVAPKPSRYNSLHRVCSKISSKLNLT